MGSYLREVHTIGIHLRHRKGFAGRQFGYVHWLGFHEVEFIMSVRRRELWQWILRDFTVWERLSARRAGQRTQIPCRLP